MSAPNCDKLLTKSRAKVHRGPSARGERRARHKLLLLQLVEHLHQLFKDLVPKAQAEGRDFVPLLQVFPPIKETDPDDGQRYYKYDAELTHWAGLGDDGQPLPAEEDGLPFALLLQGPLIDGKTDPRKLPGGKTAARILMERVMDQGFVVSVVFHKQQIKVFAAWGLDAFDGFLASLNKRKAVAKKEREDDAKLLSLDQYLAQKEAARKPRPGATDEGGWVTAGKKKKKASSRPRPQDEE